MARFFWLICLPIGLAACGGAQMMKADQPSIIKQDEAMVVFMRSSALGSAIAASVFDVGGPETKFIGILNNGTKIAHPVKPGEHTFMVIGESADFMQATVLSGRTYYALVTPRMGVWKARFSFRPVRQIELGGYEFARWDSGTHFVTNSPETLHWASQNAAEINSKRTQYWADWISKPAGQRASQTLNPQDGRGSATADASAMSAAPASVLPASRPPESAPAAPSPPPATTPAPTTSVIPTIAVTAATTRFPRPGDSWTYQLIENRVGERPRQSVYVVRIAAASEASILDQVSRDGAPPTEWAHSRGNYLAAQVVSVFSPYLVVFEDLTPGTAIRRIAQHDDSCFGIYRCSSEGKVVGGETVRLAGGSFDTTKVTVNQIWRGSMGGGAEVGERILTIWYSPQIKRAVKVSSRVIRGSSRSLFHANFDLELMSYKLN